MLFLIPFLTAASASPSSVPSEEVDEIIVQGYTLNVEDIELKKTKPQITHSVDRDFLRAQPTNDVVTALTRLPGIAPQTDRGEKRFVQLRGLRPALNNVTVNSMPLGAPDTVNGGRQTPLDIFSTRLVERLDVIKTPTPDMEGHGIGGIIDIRPIRALDTIDQTGLSGLVNARGSSWQNDEEPTREATGLLRWVAPSQEWGVIAGLTGSRLSIDRDFIQQTRWVEFDDAFIPEGSRSSTLFEEETRYNAHLSLDYQPSDGHRLNFTAAVTSLENDEYLQRYERVLRGRVREGGDTSLNPQGPTVPGPTATTASFFPATRVSDTNATRETILLMADGAHSFEKTDLRWYASWNDNQLEENELRWNFEGEDSTGAGVILENIPYTVNNDGIVRFGAGEVSRLSDVAFSAGIRIANQVTVSDEAIIFGGDVEHEVTPYFRVKTGARWRQTQRQSDLETDRLFTETSNFFALGDLETLDPPGGESPYYALNLRDIEQRFAENIDVFTPDILNNIIDSQFSDYDIQETVTAGYV
ncbi:MAG: TonB-dependent receptor plug domain-containing protein, partial [Pseudomonadota bacterium]